MRNYEADNVNALIEELRQALITSNDLAIVKQMKKIVPEFISNNSVFCQLDQK